MTAIYRTKSLWTAALLLGAALILMLPSCNQTTEKTEPAVQPTAPPAVSKAPIDEEHGLHQLSHARLKEIMARLSSMKFGEIVQEIDTTGELQRDICDVSKLAVELADEARAIPLIQPDLNLNDESRRVMNELSARLYDEAVALRDHADAGDVRLVKIKLDEMISTCNACHASFRAPAVAAAAPFERSSATSRS